MYRIGAATTKPASGPAMPISKICLRFARMPSMLITAPIVPIKLNGTGMQSG